MSFDDLAQHALALPEIERMILHDLLVLSMRDKGEEEAPEPDPADDADDCVVLDATLNDRLADYQNGKDPMIDNSVVLQWLRNTQDDCDEIEEYQRRRREFEECKRPPIDGPEFMQRMREKYLT